MKFVGYLVSVAFGVVVVIVASRPRALPLPGRVGHKVNFRVLYGADGRRSTSRLVAFVWLVVLIAASAALMAEIVFGEWTLSEAGLENLNEQYLLLIGIPVGTLIAAKGIVETRTSNGTLQKTPTNDTDVGGFATDDKGRGDLVDLQYLGFNAVLVLYVIGSVWGSRTLPDLPETLLGLTGASAAAFVADKIVESNPPSITAATRQAATTVVIEGQNLLQPAVEGDWTSHVHVSGQTVTAVPTWETNGTRITATVAAQPAVGTVVTVRTAAGVTVKKELE